jgi:serine/threonine-protein kinase
MAHPESLGKYTIKTLLGEGAMGVVYKAFDPSIGRLVAIKTIRRAQSQDQHVETSLADRFRNEARAVGRINHPGIVAIYDLGQDGDNAFIVMEYVEGRDLSQILAATPKLPELDVLQIMRQLLDALDCAHQQGVWHRDIKPANLIITTTGQLKVTDFGIARIETAALTMVTSSIGTPGYMAPEQYVGESFDHRVDVFAAGVLLYRMLAGQAPFTGTPEAVMYGIMTKEAPSLSALLGSEMAAFYDPIIARALAKDPSRRYPSATAFWGALRSRISALEGVSNESTVVLHAASIPSERPSANQRSGRLTASGTASQTLPTHWDDVTLVPIQSVLARFVGPMAKVLVRQAAKKCADIPSLISSITQELPSPEDRAKFVEMLQHQTGNVTPGTAALTTGSIGGAGSLLAQHTLEAALTERATQIMTRFIGPIAKIVVKKAAAKSTSVEQFVALLAQELPEGAQRSQLIAELS